ncbi:MAG: hypothetical protein U0931_21555 [Vulcanimicrobiota bacterium]
MRRRLGSFLIQVIFFAIVVAMFVSASIAIAHSATLRGQQQARKQRAERAIKSGIDYAIARVRATPGGDWRAQTATTVQIGDLFVSEKDGQVIGWLREGENWSRFRMTFNFRNGAGGADRLDDPTTGVQTLSPCFNNLMANSGFPMPTDPTVATALDARLLVPAHSLLLRIEGASGSASASPGSSPADFYSSPAILQAESIQQLQLTSTPQTDAVLSSPGSLKFWVKAGQAVTLDSEGASQARMRTKTDLEVLDETGGGGFLASPAGQLRTPNVGRDTGRTQILSTTMSFQSEQATDPLYRITLGQAPATSTGSAQLDAGVYEVNLVNGSPVIKRFAMSIAAYKAQRVLGPVAGGSVVTLDPSVGVTVKGGKVELHFSKDTRVNPSGTLQDLAIVPAGGAYQEADNPPPPPPLGGGALSTQERYVADLATLLEQQLIMAPTMATAGQSTSTTYTGFADVRPSVFSAIQKLNPGARSVTAGPITLDLGAGTVDGISGWDAQNRDALPGTYNYSNGALLLAQALLANSSCQRDVEEMLGQPLPSFVAGIPTPAPRTSSAGLSVDDLAIRLEGPGTSTGLSDPVTLRGQRDILLGGAVQGLGGAIVAPGNLSLLGNGAYLRAANSVNLYSGGDLLIDGFALDPTGKIYNDVNLQGVVYALGQITINVGQAGSAIPWGTFNLEGAMVAYNPGSSVRIRAANSRLFFEPSYLTNVLESPFNSRSSFVSRAYHQQ